MCCFVSLVFCNFWIAKCLIDCCSVYSSFAAMDRVSNPFLVINVDCTVLCSLYSNLFMYFAVEKVHKCNSSSLNIHINETISVINLRLC